MSSTIWSKFFWSDWANDPALRLCSLAAQGLWMRCLCIAAESDPIGYVTINGRALGVTDIARLAGVAETEASALIDELDRNGVFSRDRSGRIYSRRMLRDAKMRATAKKNGKQGGNPKLCSNNDISASDNPPLKGLDKPQEPEASIPRVREEPNGSLPETSSGEKPKRKRRDYPDQFEAFWRGYPTDANMSKVEAFTVWRRIPQEEREAAIESLPAFRAYCAANPDYRPVYANRYLSKARYEGHLQTAQKIQDRVFVRRGSPEWDAWQQVKKTQAVMSSEHRCEGWWFPTQWPQQSSVAA